MSYSLMYFHFPMQRIIICKSWVWLVSHKYTRLAFHSPWASSPWIDFLVELNDAAFILKAALPASPCHLCVFDAAESSRGRAGRGRGRLGWQCDRLHGGLGGLIAAPVRCQSVPSAQLPAGGSPPRSNPQPQPRSPAHSRGPKADGSGRTAGAASDPSVVSWTGGVAHAGSRLTVRARVVTWVKFCGPRGVLGRGGHFDSMRILRGAVSV